MHARVIPPRLAALFASLLLVILGSTLVTTIHWTPAPGRPVSMRGAGTAPEPELRSGEGPSIQADSEAFWTDRLTYPTGRFDPRWLLNATQQDRQVARGVPAGQVIYNRAVSRSPLALDPSRFTSLGPRPVSSFGLNWSGRVNSIAFDPVVTSTAYLAVNGGGVWKTTNCCASSTTWTPTTDGPEIPIIAVDDVIVDPHDHNTIYAGTGDLNFTIPEYPSAGILKSTDQGGTWAVLGAEAFAPPYPEPPGTYPQDQAVGKVRVDPRDSNHLVAGTARGVYVSYNAGADWSGPCYTNPYTSTQRQDTTGLLLRDNGAGTDMYVAVGTRAFSVTIHPVMAENGADGIYQATLPSSGCPASWTLVSRPDNGWPAGTGGGVPFRQGGNTVGRIDLAFAPSTTGPGSSNVTIYAQAQSASSLGQLGVWRTTDGGATWERRSTASALGGCGFDTGQNWFNQYVTVDPTDSQKLYMGAYDIWKSTDGGTTFNDQTCGFAVHPDQHALTLAPGAPNVILAGSDGGSFLSTDSGDSWVDLNGSLSTLEFYGGDTTGNFANAPEPGAAGGTQDNGSMVNVWSGLPGPTPWAGVIGGDGYWSRIEPVLGQRWYLETNSFDGQRHIWMSDTGPNGGYQDISANWLRVRSNFIYPYELYKYDCPATGCTHMIMGTSAVSETVTGVGDWITVSPVFTGNITQLSYSVSLSTTALVGLSNGQVQYGFGLGRSGMATWVNVAGGNAVLPNRSILDVTTDPTNPLVGYAAVGGFDENTPGTPGHVFQVTCMPGCAGFTWANKTGNLPDIPADSILANPRYPQQVFVGTDWGLYYTNDITAASPVWARFDAGLPHVMIYDMTIDAGFTTLAVWTRSRGGFAWPLPGEPWPPALTPSATPVRSATVPATLTPTRTITPTSSATVPPGTTPTATRTAMPTLTSTPCVLAFSDVRPADYFYQPVSYLYCHGVISGYADGTFRPYNLTTRGQLAKIVVLAQGWPLYTPPSPTFRDVTADNPFYLPIETAYNRQVISGYSCGAGCLEYRPGNNVTRGQLTKIIVLAQGWAITPPGTPTFRDVAQTDPFYGYIETAYAHNVISGYSCGAGCLEFRPGSNATRGQISKIVYIAISGLSTGLAGARAKAISPQPSVLSPQPSALSPQSSVL